MSHMNSNGFRAGFLHKLSEYNINPESIYGNLRLDDTDNNNILYDTYFSPSELSSALQTPKFDVSKWLEKSRTGRALQMIFRNKLSYGKDFLGIGYNRRW